MIPTAFLRTIYCILIIGTLAGCNLECATQYNYLLRPAGYHWRRALAPTTKDWVYYGIDPSNGWTVYVGPDNIYYKYPSDRGISPPDIHSRWCPNNAVSQHGNITFIRGAIMTITRVIKAALAHHDHLSNFTYTHRPAGYHWKAKVAPDTGVILYYGIDPVNRWIVYVGPDNVYYTFSRWGNVQPGDIPSVWDPHDVNTTDE